MTPAEYYADMLSRTEPIKAAIDNGRTLISFIAPGFEEIFADLLRGAFAEVLADMGHKMTMPLATCSAATELDYYGGIQ